MAIHPPFYKGGKKRSLKGKARILPKNAKNTPKKACFLISKRVSWSKFPKKNKKSPLQTMKRTFKP